EAGDHSSHPSAKTRALLDQIDKGEDFFGIEALTPAFHARMASIGEYLQNPRFFIDRPDECLEAIQEEWDNGEEAYQARVEEHRLAFPVPDFFLDDKEFKALIQSGKRVEAETLEIAGEQIPSVRISVE